MPLTVTEKEALLAKRKGHFEDAKAALDLSRESTGGEPDAEALATANRLIDEADAITKRIEDDDKSAANAKAVNDRLAATERTLRQGSGRLTNPAPRADNPYSNQLVISGNRFDPNVGPAARRNTPDYEAAFGAFVRGVNHGPHAAFQLDNAEAGGVLAPPRFVAEMIKELDENFVFRRLAKVQVARAREVTYPRRTTRERRMQKGQVWTSAGTAGKVGTATWTLHPFTGEVQANKALIQFADFDVAGYLRDEINYDRSVTQEQLFMTGEGDQEPFGLFTAADLGLPTSADVVSAGAIGYDTIVNFKMSLRDVYLNMTTCRVICHRNFQKTLMKIRTTDGVTLFQPSLVVGQPDTMLGVPMLFSEFAPAGTNGVYANNDYAAVIGDLKQYMIYESPDYAIEQHNLDTRSNLASWLYRNWFDGNVRLTEAFKRLQKTA